MSDEFQLRRVVSMLDDIRGFLLVITVLLACILACVCGGPKDKSATPAAAAGVSGE